MGARSVCATGFSKGQDKGMKDYVLDSDGEGEAAGREGSWS